MNSRAVSGYKQAVQRSKPLPLSIALSTSLRPVVYPGHQDVYVRQTCMTYSPQESVSEQILVSSVKDAIISSCWGMPGSPSHVAILKPAMFQMVQNWGSATALGASVSPNL